MKLIGQRVTGAVETQSAPPGSALRVFLIVIEPGDRPLSRFGHSAVWIQDTVARTNSAYNYGASDTREADFIRNLIEGGAPTHLSDVAASERALERYVHENRSVWIQELNLSPTQKAALRDLLAWDDRPRNASFTYQFYRENCTTSIRDALDWVLDGQLWDATSTVVSTRTLRWHTDRLAAVDPLLSAAVAVVLGQPVDRPITVWEEMFLPETLRDRLRTLTIRDEAGNQVPLVLAEELWFESTRTPAPSEPPRRWPMHLLLGTVLGGILALNGGFAEARLPARLAVTAFGGAWLFTVGVIGTLLSALWAFTDQYVAYRNENLLQLNPLHLVLAVLLLVAAFGSLRAIRAARWLAIALAGVAVLGLLLKLVPGFIQANGPVLALTVPAHVGLAYGIWRWSAHSERDQQLLPTEAAGDHLGHGAAVDAGVPALG